MKSTPETAPKQSSEKEVNEYCFRNLVEKALSPICILKGENMVLELGNQPLFNIWNIDKEAIGKPLVEILPEVNGTPIMGWLLDVYHKAVTLKLYEIPFTFIRKNGEKEALYFNFNYQPYYESNGTISGVMAQASDITEQVMSRKKIEDSNQKIQNLIGQAPVAMCLYKGSDYKMEIVNDKMLQIWGKPLKTVINKSIFEAMPEAKGQGFEQLLHKVYTTGESFSANEISINLLRNEKNEKIYINLLYEPYRETDGTITGIVEIANDVTEQVITRKKIEESETRFRLALIGSNQVVFSQDKNLKHTWIYNSHPDFKSEDIVGKSDKELHVPTTAKILSDIKNKVLDTGKSFDGDVEIELGGQLLTYNLRIEATRDANAVITGITGMAMDITERVKEQQKIRESEEQFNTFSNNIQNLAWIAEGNGNIFWYNQRWFDYTGTTLKEMQGWGWQKVHHPDHVDGVVKSVKKLWTINAPFELTFPLKRFDGQYRWFLTRAVPITNEQGEIYRWIGTNTDIDDKVKIEEKIKESEQEIRKIKDQLELSITAGKIGVWHWDVKQDVLTWSKEQKAMYGLEPSEALLNITEYKAMVIPEDWERLNKELQSAPMAEEQEYDFRIIRKKDGEVRWIKSRAKNITDEKGGLAFISGVNIDITEQVEALNKIKESEERFRSLAQTLPQLVWVTDEKGNAEFASEKWKEYTGIETGDEQTWRAIVHPDDYDNINAAWLHSLTTGDVYNFDVRLKNKDGEYRWHTVKGEPVLDKEMKIVKWVGAFTDIHAEKTFTQELEFQVEQRTKELGRKNMELEKMNKELQSFAYISSHDLQEPLRKIQTFASRITDTEETNLSDNGKNMFKRMQEAAKRMQQLIQDLLAYSKSSSNEEFKFENINLKQIIEEVKEDLHDDIEQTHAIIEVSELCKANIIPFQFRQLMHNLIGNSLKFRKPDNPPYIIIKSEIAKGSELNNQNLKTQTTYCHITVRDNGIGFDQQYNEKIFEVFQRLHGKHEYNGTGIGLSIVKKIVENHNGIITANGELNKGATFDIYIPAT